jgi:signal transduction histidine kinase
MPHQPIPRMQSGGELAEELLAILAHELRRPLTALLGALATVQQRHHALSVLQQQKLLGIARRQGEQLGRLLDQVLATAGMDRGRAGVARRSLVDAAVAEEAGVAARLAHSDHRITIEVAGPLLVWVDPLAVSRILGNLLDNAAAYSPSGARIWLSASRDRAHAVLAVQDHGPGIAAADRERIFQPYTRLGQLTASAGGSGLGLGLYIARRLARANRGELQATDPPGRRGARLELRLPLATPSTPRTGDPAQ